MKWRPDYNTYDHEWRVYDDEEMCPIINSLFKPLGKEGEKTARLIARAPDMRETLNQLGMWADAIKELYPVHSGLIRELYRARELTDSE